METAEKGAGATRAERKSNGSPRVERQAGATIAAFRPKERPETDAAEAIFGVQFQIENLEETVAALDPAALPPGSRGIAALHGMQALLAEANVVLTRIRYGFKGGLDAPSLAVVALQVRAVPIALAVAGMRSEAVPADLGYAVEAYVERFGGVRSPEDIAVLDRAAKILKSDTLEPDPAATAEGTGPSREA